MEQVQWIILWQQNRSKIVPPVSELLITEDSIILETESGQDLETEGT